MDNKEKYIKAFTEVFSMDDEKVCQLKYAESPEWDSVGHMNLIAALEEAFDIMMDTDDIIDLSSFVQGQEILRERYQVEI